MILQVASLLLTLEPRSWETCIPSRRPMRYKAQSECSLQQSRWDQRFSESCNPKRCFVGSCFLSKEAVLASMLVFRRVSDSGREREREKKRSKRHLFAKTDHSWARISSSTYTSSHSAPVILMHLIRQLLCTAGFIGKVILQRGGKRHHGPCGTTLLSQSHPPHLTSSPSLPPHPQHTIGPAHQASCMDPWIVSATIAWRHFWRPNLPRFEALIKNGSIFPDKYHQRLGFFMAMLVPAPFKSGWRP